VSCEGSAGGAGEPPRGIDRGALVASVEDGSPAATAGIFAGDIIVDVAGTAITGPDSLRLALGDRPGQTVELILLRGGAKLVLQAALGSRP
jgi:S1-C subfamily serine protease